MEILVVSGFLINSSHSYLHMEKKWPKLSKTHSSADGYMEGACASVCADMGMILQMKWVQHCRGDQGHAGVGLEHSKCCSDSELSNEDPSVLC